MAYRALDIAEFLIFLMSGNCEDLTNMKLNKILYYAQGHYLKQFGKPLFSDSIEAWPHGPVVKDVYQKYKGFSNQAITEYDISAVQRIDDDTKSFLVDIARTYGRFTAAALRNMTHRSGAPWSKVEEGDVIPIDLILQYFQENEDSVQPLQIVYDEDDFVGQRDAEGYLVLPKDWRDEEV